MKNKINDTEINRSLSEVNKKTGMKLHNWYVEELRKMRNGEKNRIKTIKESHVRTTPII